MCVYIYIYIYIYTREPLSSRNEINGGLLKARNGVGTPTIYTYHFFTLLHGDGGLVVQFFL